MKKIVIFTDMDGTLLDEENYSYAEAQPALHLIAARGIPLIFCSSKTRSELVAFRAKLNTAHPFITENGGGIFIPHGYFSAPMTTQVLDAYQIILLGTPYIEIRSHFIRLRNQLCTKARGFGDMSVTEVAALTGLSEEEATLARQRDFDEPFIFEGAPDMAFLQAIQAAGLHWTQGRIFHIMGKHDKGHAVRLLTSLYEQQYGGVTSIALGDGLNDLPMLNVVDLPVLVRHKDGSFEDRINIPNFLKTRLPGPAGWNESVLLLLTPVVSGHGMLLKEGHHLTEIFNAGLRAADPYNAVLRVVKIEHQRLHISGQSYSLAAFKRVVVIGAGKATARMALAIESLLNGRIDSGLIVVKNGHTEPLSIIEQIESSHPVPGESGVHGTIRVLEMAQAANDDTLVICLLSGGASALLVSPVAGLTLQDKQEATRLLLNAGASISELNAVRKHLSAVKGGRLAQAVFPAPLITLILSDVIGDPLDVIASGPTAADNSTFNDAWSVVLKYGLLDSLPSRVSNYLRSGMAGNEPETMQPNAIGLSQTHNFIIANIHQALLAAQEKSGQLGFASRVVSDTLQGEARIAAHHLAEIARSELATMEVNTRRCLLCGGETTVTVAGYGIGGRNQELALAFSLEIEGLQGVAFLSAGTDGTDGPTDAAGAMVDGTTATIARSLGIDPLSYLDHNDSYTFFQQFDAATGKHCHLKTGPTGTNVMDIQVVLLSKEESSSAQTD